MSDQTYVVSLEKDNLVFSAAHFITFNKNICEQLHGHNYRVKCRVYGPLDINGYVVDFIALRDALMDVIGTLDHRMLLPTLHDQISVDPQGEETVVRFEQKRWVFPKEDCVLLPIANTTAELLASYIGKELIKLLKPKVETPLLEIKIAVDENRGQWAWATLNWD